MLLCMKHMVFSCILYVISDTDDILMCALNHLFIYFFYHPTAVTKTWMIIKCLGWFIGICAVILSVYIFTTPIPLKT